MDVETMDQIQPVILSGGSGTRLWPLSREHYPKQLIPFVEDDSLFQSTVRRTDGVAGGFTVNPRPLVVCNEAHRFLIAEQLRQAGRQAQALILEPVGRNTAPALTLAALHLTQGGADCVMLVMPADHVVRDRPAFLRAVERAAALAGEGGVVTFGIVPDRPETGYGYIRRGAPLPGGAGHVLAGFVEKPDLATAQGYVDGGEYWWNSGLFALKASVWLASIGLFNRAILDACTRAYEGGTADADFRRVETTAFAACPSDSIDYAVMEKLVGAGATAAAAQVLPLDAGWSDVGAWDALWQILDRDENGNATRGDALLHDSSGSLVMAQGRLVACVGITDMVVVETPDVVMVAPRARAQDVKQLVAKVKASGRSLAESHRKVYRPWGSYDSIDNGERFQVKRIIVNPGASLSLQKHHHRAEHWIVVQGTAEVTRGEDTFLLAENQSTYIPLGVTHRLVNPGKIPLEMIEVQSGSYLGEDDIVRFQDHYGRA
jgi:mannose-1-phosphate guanylyltransferase / mannose-6-phosphate isomerase